jgi:drug/metabolite transporter (DMT)-like permease
VLTVVYTLAALVAFAANSVLCRVALIGHTIDPTTFLTVRFASGAVTLLVVAGIAGRARPFGGSWVSAAVLFLYGIPFSIAYLGLTAGAGALILFGSVQVAMIAAAVGRREHLGVAQWFGVGVALAGLAYLTRPGLSAPPLVSAALMCVAGVGWGIYSLRGRTAANAIGETTGNFLRLVPLLGLVSAFMFLRGQAHTSARGLLLAAASGSIGSGLGYVIWYRALRGLTRARASVVQLAVPVMAAIGGWLLLGEDVTSRLAIAGAMVLGGIAMTSLRA